MEGIDNVRNIDHLRAVLGTSLGVFLCYTIIPDAKGEDTSNGSEYQRKFLMHTRHVVGSPHGLLVCLGNMHRVPCSCLSERLC
jgi:hypothetical protein